MEIQLGGKWTSVGLPQDPLGDMLFRQAELQRSLGIFDSRLSDVPGRSFVLQRHAIHSLDCAIQEVAEAYDLLEGGWKGHKKNPRSVDVDELMLEFVDIACYVFNAYLYMGGDASGQGAAIAVSRGGVTRPVAGPVTIMELVGGSAHAEKLVNGWYNHGATAHGPAWVAESAAWTNWLRSVLSETVATLRYASITSSTGEIPAGSGYIVVSAFGPLFAAASRVPGFTEPVFYSAFVHKNAINRDRVSRGY